MKHRKGSNIYIEDVRYMPFETGSRFKLSTMV